MTTTTQTKRYWNKPSAIAVIMTVGAVLLMGCLSVWQFQRLGWKEALIDRIEKAQQSPAVDVLPEKDKLSDFGFYRYQVRGHFLPEVEFHLAARYYKSQLGYHLLVPFKLEDGRLLLVNRGWVPVKLKEVSERPDSVASSDEQTITVMLRTDKDHTMFTPVHDTEENIWFWRDIEAMNRFSGLTLLPVTADLIAEAVPKTLPVPSNGEIKLRNDHLGYALTWLMIGISAITIFVLYHYRKQEDTDI